MEKSKFHLEKWYLDFVGKTGEEAMIFYAAKLSFMGMMIYYGHWIQYDKNQGVKRRTHYRKVELPEKTDSSIHWKDEVFKISGVWQSTSTPLFSQIYRGKDGSLDWHCLQPYAKVKLHVKERDLEGQGYAEQLTLTTFPWHIPMEELRWGRFQSPEALLVWIELRGNPTHQWVWLNGEELKNCRINDGVIVSVEKELKLLLDCNVLLESENRIAKVTRQISRFIPGFKLMMPSGFFAAVNKKWLSRGELYIAGKHFTSGLAIHEWVNFKGSY